MTDMSKEIVFKDGITLDNGVEDLTESLLSVVGQICDLGRQFGLSLDVFGIDEEMIYFEWRGTKRDTLAFYTYYSTNLTTEPLEELVEAQKVILSK
nr:hypothetical protein [uncultured Blautia sp.]